MLTQEASFSTSASTHQWKHDVFLSFRGEDTRNNFTSHLYRALQQKGIQTFLDDQLRRGKQISPALLEAIEGSRISIVVFSINYASSSWCLDELVKIIDCSEFRGQQVLPVFYNVDPSEVRKQTGNYSEAFDKHEITYGSDMGRVQAWKESLKKAANLSGWDLKNRDEAKFIQEIVTEVLSKLDITPLIVAANPVGIESLLFEVNSLLALESDEVRMIGIYGIGGIGKTTLAKALYNQIFCKFDSSSFLANVREISEKRGIDFLQETLLSDILELGNVSAGKIYRRSNRIKDRIRNKKVLIVLDDVDNLNQLNCLAGEKDWFGSGSRIIITTRNRDLLAHKLVIETSYEVKEMSFENALQLFSWNAFREPNPAKEFQILSCDIIDYAKGLPLALVLLGSFLRDATIEEWKCTLAKLKKIPNREVYDTLMITFEELEDHEKDIFLDIACFFNGMNKEYVTRILESCDLFPEIGIKVLVNKSLLSIESSKLRMHDSLEEMGKQIVRRESKVPGKRSRLWRYEDIYDVLTEDMGSDQIEAIVVPHGEKMQLDPKAFIKMKMLRLLIVRGNNLSGELDYLPNELRWLEWPECPMLSLPPNFQARKLVSLSIGCSRIKPLLQYNFQAYKMLKYMRLSHCGDFTRIPDLSRIQNLEHLSLFNCTSLVEVHQSIGSMHKLVQLDLIGSTSLETLPSLSSKSLERLSLNNCSSLEEFPDISNLSRLQFLDVSKCRNLKSLPASISDLPCLETLFLTGCSKLETCSASTSTGFLALKGLCLRDCKQLDLNFLAAPNLFPSLRNLKLSNNDLLSIELLDKFSNSSRNMLQLLEVTNCKNLTYLPSGIANLPSLEKLLLSGCLKLGNFFDPNFTSYDSTDSSNMRYPALQDLDLRDCGLSELNFLMTSNCFPNLEYLVLPGLDLASFVTFVSKLEKLKYVYVKDCKFPSKINLNHDFLKGMDQNVTIDISSNGVEMPEWFSYQSTGSVVSFKVPVDMCKRITGLAFCAIFEMEEEVKKMPSLCEVDLLINGQSCNEEPIYHVWEGGDFWMQFLPLKWVKGTGKLGLVHMGWNEFHASFTSPVNDNGLVKKCGVHLVFKELDERGDDFIILKN